MKSKTIKMLALSLLAALSLQAQATETPKKILVVVSSVNQLPLKNGKTYSTGFYMNELGVPTKAMVDAGYTLVFANPQGNPATMDASSDNLKYFNNDQEEYQEIKNFLGSLAGLQSPLRLRDVIVGGLDQYAGIFLPGGHAPMTDLMASPELGKILSYFHATGKPTALICHAPVALVSTVSDPVEYQQAMIAGDSLLTSKLAKGWIYSGYHMTVFSSAEEAQAETKLGGEPLYLPEDVLGNAGGKVSVAAPWQSEVIVDRELVTGQNPFSDKQLVKAFLGMLESN